MDDKFNKKRIVAFIDILGFTDLVNKSENLEKIYDAVNKLHTYANEGITFGGIDSYYSKKEIRDKQISVFSDLIVISYAYHEDNQFYSYMNLYELLGSLMRMHALLIKDKILIRGGITIGNLFHSGGICIGKGLIDAYYIESKVATYPIVILAPEIINSQEYNSFDYKKVIDERIISRLENGIPYIDYFKEFYQPYSPIGENTPQRFDIVDKSYLLSLKLVIEEGLVSPKIDIKAKYMWLAEKYHKLIALIQETSKIETKDRIDDYKI